MKRIIGLCSIAVSIVVLTGCNIHPPLTPGEPTGPSSGQIGQPYAFTTRTIDPLGMMIMYRFDWDDGTISDWSEPVVSGSPVTMDKRWDENGTYGVRSQAKNLINRASRWSPPHQVTIGGQPGGYPDSVIAIIPVGGDPVHLACLPNGEYVYVGHETLRRVSVIRTSDNTELPPITTNHRSPWHIACHPDSRFVYAVNHGWGVTVIRTSDNTVVDTIPIGIDANSAAVSPDGRHLYVANDASTNSVTVIRTSDNTIIASVPVGADPRDVAVLPNGRYVYTANTGSGTVSVIRTSDHTVVATVAVNGSPHRVLPSLDGQYVYVTEYSCERTTVIRTSDHTLVGTVNQGGVGMGTIPGYLYVADAADNCVHVVSIPDNEVKALVPVGNGPWAVDALPSGTALYTCDRYSNQVSVLGYSRGGARNEPPGELR